MAAIVTDELVPGSFALEIGGYEQSHVSLENPETMFYDYMRRIGAVVDRIRMPGAPIIAVHLGAGALTLPRYIAVTRPGSEQHVIELEHDLVGFVCEHLPLPAGTRLAVHSGDAAAQVAELRGGRGGGPDARGHDGARPGAGLGAPADIVVCDVYRGTTTPRHLMTTEFYASVAQLLAPDGVIVVNVADDPGMPALRIHLAAIAPVAPHMLVAATRALVDTGDAGNAVIVASPSPDVLAWADGMRVTGPHPGVVLSSADGPVLHELP
jgi:hypothetical protein